MPSSPLSLPYPLPARRVSAPAPEQCPRCAPAFPAPCPPRVRASARGALDVREECGAQEQVSTGHLAQQTSGNITHCVTRLPGHSGQIRFAMVGATAVLMGSLRGDWVPLQGASRANANNYCPRLRQVATFARTDVSAPRPCPPDIATYDAWDFILGDVL